MDGWTPEKGFELDAQSLAWGEDTDEDLQMLDEQPVVASSDQTSNTTTFSANTTWDPPKTTPASWGPRPNSSENKPSLREKARSYSRSPSPPSKRRPISMEKYPVARQTPVLKVRMERPDSVPTLSALENMAINTNNSNLVRQAREVQEAVNLANFVKESHKIKRDPMNKLFMNVRRNTVDLTTIAEGKLYISTFELSSLITETKSLEEVSDSFEEGMSPEAKAGFRPFDSSIDEEKLSGTFAFDDMDSRAEFDRWVETTHGKLARSHGTVDKVLGTVSVQKKLLVTLLPVGVPKAAFDRMWAGRFPITRVDQATSKRGEILYFVHVQEEENLRAILRVSLKKVAGKHSLWSDASKSELRGILRDSPFSLSDANVRKFLDDDK